MIIDSSGLYSLLVIAIPEQQLMIAIENIATQCN
jgi:hypothetical protein